MSETLRYLLDTLRDFVRPEETRHCQTPLPKVTFGRHFTEVLCEMQEILLLRQEELRLLKEKVLAANEEQLLAALPPGIKENIQAQIEKELEELRR